MRPTTAAVQTGGRRHVFFGLPWLVLCLMLVVACGNKSSSPVAPTPEPDPPAPPPVTTFTVSGRVLDQAASAPLAAARVEVSRGGEDAIATEADTEGRYHIDNLPAGSYALRASADGYDPSSVSLEIEADRVVDLALARAGSPTDPPAPPPDRWTFGGTVRDAASAEVLPNVRIDVIEGTSANVGNSTTTDADGRFALTDLLGGPLTARASLDGYAPKSVSVTLQADTTVDVALDRLPPPGPQVSGRVVDVLTDRPLAGVTVRIDGGGETTSDENGSFTLAGVDTRETQQVVLASPDIVERRTYVRVPGTVEALTVIPRSIDLRTLDEMLRARGGLHRWMTAPRLVIERRALVFTNTTDTSYVAGSDEMTEAEAADLAADLAWALPQMTGGTFSAFAAVDVELAAEGDSVAVSRTDAIVVARYEGLKDSLSVLGFGRWAWNAAGEVQAGVLMIDNAFDRTQDPSRRALRAHELGHTLGYDHVSSNASVMHPSGRIEPTDFDRDATRIAFRRPPLNASPDTDPDPDISRPVSAHLSWAGTP